MTLKFFNFINNLNILNNKESAVYCKYVNDSLIFDSDNSVKLCPLSDFGMIRKNFNGIWLDIDEITAVKSKCIDKLSNVNSKYMDNVPEMNLECTDENLALKSKNINESKNEKIPCVDCMYFQTTGEKTDKTIKSYKSVSTVKQAKAFKYLYLSQWKNCYLNCSYCTKPKQNDLIAANHYDILPSIQRLIDNKLINKKTKIIFECGDACIHPEFDKILFFFINYEMEDIEIHTPAMRYCESISEAIAKNIGKVIVSFDSGCPYIYEKIKNVNKFDIAVCNLKRYLSYQEPDEKRVLLKYVIIKGVNDNKKEILDWFMLAGDFGVKKLVLDIEYNFFEEIRHNIPYYIKELLVFAVNISVYNNLEIEFYDRVNILYKSFNKDEIKD